MEIDIIRQLIRRYNKERSKDIWILLERYIDDKSPCKGCGGPVLYHNSRISLTKEGVVRYDTNFSCSRSCKEIEGRKYYLSYCQSCISNEFPEYETMNKSRVFNVINKITKYAYCIPDEDAKKITQKTAVTLENFKEKYGEDEGARRWEEYRNIQAVTNTFEYKKEKYGWNEKDFKEFNKGRAVTLRNLIKKHGEDEGTRMFNEYVEKQKVNGKTLDWFIEKYGENCGKLIYKDVSLGKAKGSKSSRGCSSNVSQIFFEKLDSYLSSNYTTYYQRKNGEKIFYVDKINKSYLLDYYIEELKVSVEFNGDYYHANPKKYHKDFKFQFSPRSRIFTAEDVWEKDRIKEEHLMSEYGIRIVTVWENDYYKNKDNEDFYKNIIKSCIKK